MQTFKERVKASPATKAKLGKPLGRTDAADMKRVVRNIVSSLDQLAWKMENQIIFDKPIDSTIKKIDSLIKEAKLLEKELKQTLKV
jgi:hypothetical protein